MNQNTYLIIGGSSGVGFETARLLLKDPDNVVVLMGRDEVALLDAYEALSMPGDSASSRIHYATCDINVPGALTEEVKRMFNGTLKWPFAGVFLAAGDIQISRASSSAVNERVLAPARALIELAALASRGYCLTKGGGIVVMSSVAAQRGNAGLSAYSAAKGAVDAAVRALAMELAPSYRVNGIAAGAFVSPLHQRVIEGMSKEGRAAYEAKHPLGFGTALNVAYVADFLLSPKSSWVTGAIWAVDGGYLAK